VSGALLLSGATGYLGRHAAARLQHAGHAVHALVRPNSPIEALQAAAPATRLHVYDGGYPSIEAAGRAGPFEAIVHIAGVGQLVTPPVEIPALVDVSVTLPAWLMALAVSGTAPRVVLVGSYWAWSDGENSAPNSVYAAAKVGARAIADHYAAFHGLEAVELAMHDVYGPNDVRRKLFNLLDEASRTGLALDMTAGEQRIAPIHVSDACAAIEAALVRDATPRCASYATAGPEIVSLRQLVATFERATGRKVVVNWGALPYPRGQIMQPWMGRPLPNWKPIIKLEQGLREIFG